MFSRFPTSKEMKEINKDLKMCLEYLHSEDKDPDVLPRLVEICLTMEKARCLYSDDEEWPNDKTLDWVFYNKDPSVFYLAMEDVKLLKLLEDRTPPKTKPRYIEHIQERCWDTENYCGFDVGGIDD
jgi:hypothetical protein